LKNNLKIVLLLLLSGLLLRMSAQNSTFSPYSRYGLGELSPATFAHNLGMGGAHIALKPDSTMPVFINAGNPAAYSLIRLTVLEVGGRYNYSDFSSGSSNIKKWGTNFAYAALGVPVKGNGGLSLGISPFSFVGYDTEQITNDASIGDVTYRYGGSGGINKAHIGYGVMPFYKRLNRFRKKNLYIHDSLKHLSPFAYKTSEAMSKVLSDFSAGFNVNYIFGTISNTARVIYPNSLLYNNTYRERSISASDFTGNFGFQTGYTIDSVSAGASKRALRDKVKFTFGYFMNLNNPMSVFYSSTAYNYILNGSGNEVVRDTVLYKIDQLSSFRLPLEQGFGIGFKKGERINLVADYAITDWRKFKFPDFNGSFKNNSRISVGVNFVPEKYAGGRGALLKRINYRLGFTYQTGYIELDKKEVKDYFVSAGIGVPVGIARLSSMVNVSLQYGQSGFGASELIKENYFRVHFGFTFSDRWFQKFRYD
jgi:hypothetical protein